MVQDKIGLGAVWHLVNQRNQEILLTLCEPNIEIRQALIGKPWSAIPDETKRRIIDVLETLESAA